MLNYGKLRRDMVFVTRLTKEACLLCVDFSCADLVVFGTCCKFCVCFPCCFPDVLAFIAWVVWVSLYAGRRFSVFCLDFDIVDDAGISMVCCMFLAGHGFVQLRLWCCCGDRHRIGYILHFPALLVGSFVDIGPVAGRIGFSLRACPSLWPIVLYHRRCGRCMILSPGVFLAFENLASVLQWGCMSFPVGRIQVLIGFFWSRWHERMIECLF